MTSFLNMFRSNEIPVIEEVIVKNSEVVLEEQVKVVDVINSDEEKINEETYEKLINIKNQRQDPLIALFKKGSQDDYMDQSGPYENNEFYKLSYNPKEHLLSNRYQVVYKQINSKTVIISSVKSRIHKIFIDKTNELINHVDLAITLPKEYTNIHVPINDILKCVNVCLGGTRVDTYNCEDIQTQIRTTCELFNRKIKYVNSTVFIPLVLTPFHNNNLHLLGTGYHDTTVEIELNDNCIELVDINLYGNVYYVDTKQYIKNYKARHQYISVQQQYTGAESMSCTNTKFRLFFNHPAYLIYFWGFDKTKVTNIRLQLDECDYYNGKIEPLEYLKYSKGLNIEPVVIFFSQEDLYKIPKSSVNFSMIDNSTLTITTTDKKESTVHIVGLTMQGVAYCSGMYGLIFSK
jgi:hypothetical protein